MFVGFSPGMVAVVKVDQLKRNTQLAIDSPEVTLEQVSHPKIVTDCAKIAFLTRVETFQPKLPVRLSACACAR